MTKAELIAAIAAAPADAPVFLDPGDGVLRSFVTATAYPDGTSWEIYLGFVDLVSLDADGDQAEPEEGIPVPSRHGDRETI
jgi:hypothetical protein